MNSLRSFISTGIVLFLACVPVLLADQAKVQWIGTEYQDVTFTSTVDARLAKECFEAGLELEHRFLVKLCERVNRFGTVCGDIRKEVHNISYDPIQEGYRVVKDRLGDVDDPVGITIPDVDEALSTVATVERYPLSFLQSEETPTSDEDDRVRHLGLRVRTTCKGAMSETLVDLSYFLSFGLIDLYGFDSGWNYYELRTDIPANTEEPDEPSAELPRKAS